MTQSTQADAGAWPNADEPYPLRWAAFAVVLLASVMDLLDTLVTNVAAPTIRAHLGGGTSLIQWLGAGYTLAMAVGLITGGRLGDIYGRKTMFLIGASGFTAFSVLCAASWSPGVLIGARVAQGLFGALMLPQGLGVIKEVFPPKEIAKAFGAFGPAMGLSSVGGPVLAGTLIDADIFGTGWRMIFLVNLPIGLAAIVGAVAFLPSNGEPTASRLDLAGVGLAAVAAVALVYPVVEGRELGWPAWTFVSMGASVLLFAFFGRYESRRYAAGRDTLVVPTLFRKRAFTAGLAAGLSFFSAIVGFSLVFTVFLQVGLGYSPLKAGLGALPQAIGSVIGFILAGAGLADKLGRTLIHLGTAAIAAGIVLIEVILHHAGTGVTLWDLVPALFLMGLGLGMVLAPFFDIVLAGVEMRESGSASGTLTAVQQFGGALGVAMLGTIFFGILGGHVTSGSDGLAAGLRDQLGRAGVPAAAAVTIAADLRSCEHDRAVAKDVVSTPASCGELNRAIGAVTTPTAGPLINAAVRDTATTAVRKGFGATMEDTIWFAAALQALTFMIAFLLPKRARAAWSPEAAPVPA